MVYTLRAETFAGMKFRVKKKREIIDKNLCVWTDLSQISRNLVLVNCKKNFRV